MGPRRGGAAIPRWLRPAFVGGCGRGGGKGGNGNFIGVGKSGGDGDGADGSIRVDPPVYYIGKVAFVYVLVLVDIFMNSSANSDDYGTLARNDFWPILFLVLQASCQVFIFLTLFLMMCGTYLMRMGLPGVMLADFKYLGIAQIVYLILTIILGAMRIARFQEIKGDLDPRRLWGMTGYKFMFVIQNISAALYYHQSSTLP